MVAFQSTSTAITITADGVNPSTLASQLRWKIDRDPTDTVASGTPTLSSQTGAQITLTPTVAGNFRLICYYDNNSNSSYDAGEELKVLLLSIVKISANSNDCTISQNANFQDGSSEPNEFGVLAGSLPMALSCEFLIEGGGANKKIGTNKIHFGNVGNLTGDTAKVNYSTSGIATENPGSSFPVVDSPLDPTGGDTPFRSNSLASPSNASGGGVTIALTSYDAPGFGPFATVHPSTNNIWASTEGGYDFTEFIAGYSDSFQRTYIVVGKANWTIRYVGNRNSSGIWTNSNSGMTIQGVNQSDANFTLTLSNGSPQSGDDAGIQVLGLNYVDHRSVVYS